jgi:hypothetical protein
VPHQTAGSFTIRRWRARRLALVAALLALASPVLAQPTQGGRVIFSQDFSQSVAPGLQFDREGVWSVVDGHLQAVLPNERQKRSFAYLGSEDWTDYSVDLDVCGLRGVDKGVAVRMQGGKAVVVDLRGPGYGDVLMYRGYAKLGHHAAPNPNGTWNRLRIEVLGARYRVFVNGQLAIDFSERHNKRPRGRIALVAYTGGAGQCEVLYDNLVVCELLP